MGLLSGVKEEPVGICKTCGISFTVTVRDNGDLGHTYVFRARGWDEFEWNVLCRTTSREIEEYINIYLWHATKGRLGKP